jgi:prolyl-tRNA editing enzyme YbaK/EbsC (Cys-tRNA(Pro) deacylase)
MGIPHQVFVHEGQLASIEQAAAERGQSPEQVVRSVLFRVRQGEYALVLSAGPGRLPWKALRAHLGRSRISMATPEEVLAITGDPIGAVAPVGMPEPGDELQSMRLIVDESVLKQEALSMGSGVRGTGIIIQREDLLRAIGEYEQVDLRGWDDEDDTDSDRSDRRSGEAIAGSDSAEGESAEDKSTEASTP